VQASPKLDIDQTKLNDISEYSDGQLRSPRGAQTPASPHTRLPPVLPNRQVCARAPCRFGSTAARFLRGSLSLGVFAARGGCFRRPALLDASVVVSRSKSLYLPLPHPERSAWRRSEGPTSDFANSVRERERKSATARRSVWPIGQADSDRPLPAAARR